MSGGLLCAMSHTALRYDSLQYSFCCDICSCPRKKISRHWSCVRDLFLSIKHRTRYLTMVLSDVCQTDYAVSYICSSLQLRICIDLAYIHILCFDAVLLSNIICCAQFFCLLHTVQSSLYRSVPVIMHYAVICFLTAQFPL